MPLQGVTGIRRFGVLSRINEAPITSVFLRKNETVIKKNSWVELETGLILYRQRSQIDTLLRWMQLKAYEISEFSLVV